MDFQQQSKAAIRASGGRMTSQRELLIDLLAARNDEIDAETLHQLASQQDPNLNLATVYRTLHTLESAHVITSHYVSTDHERKVYRINTKQDVFHFTCRRCGRMTAFNSPLVGQIKAALAAELGAAELTLCMCAGGLCTECQAELSK